MKKGRKTAGAPNDGEIMSQFVRVAETQDAIEVLQITWRGPHTPESQWATAATLPENAIPQQILEAKQRVLESQRWFRICQECGERNPLGWMHDESVCQGCAERHHGVVY